MLPYAYMQAYALLEFKALFNVVLFATDKNLAHYIKNL